jgi:hypothetical protein
MKVGHSQRQLSMILLSLPGSEVASLHLAAVLAKNRPESTARTLHDDRFIMAKGSNSLSIKSAEGERAEPMRRNAFEARPKA